MRLLNRDEFLNPTELPTKDVPTPELGEDSGVRMRVIGAAARYRLRAMFGDDVEVEDDVAMRFYATLLAETVIGEDGEKLCRDDADIMALCDHDPDLLARLGEEASKLSKIGVTEEEVEEAEKNSESGPTDA